MSLPREILDQLLSGYLDDALSDDERARVEQLMRDDPAIAGELQELTELGQTLREIHRGDQRVGLKPGFADRVLDATADEAAAEGLGSDHPVTIMAQRSANVDRADLPLGKIAGVLIALAASTIFAIAVFRTTDQDPEEGGLANADPRPVQVDPSDTPPDPSPIEIEAPGVNVPVEQLVQADPANDPPGPIDTPAIEEMPNSVLNPVSPANIARNTPPTAEELNLLMRGFVMVLDVSQTEEGRQSQAVRIAMTRAGLKATNQKQINKEVVGFSKRLSKDEQSVSVLYLEGPGKKLDNFINRMVLDLKGIESVGFKYVTDAPIIGVADALKNLDPTTVRHSASWNLTDEGGDSVQVLAQELSNRQFTLVKRSNQPDMSLLNIGGTEDGPDVNSRLFVLVR